jgi:hypothetical protein
MNSIHLARGWHLLETIYDEGGPLEILAATSDEGIGILVRWQRKDHDAPWRRLVTSTEGETDDISGPPDEGDPVPEEPPFVTAADDAHVDTLTAEFDRLRRTLAVERGDQSAAPEGWSVRVSGPGGVTEWTRGPWNVESQGVMFRGKARRRYRLRRETRTHFRPGPRASDRFFDTALSAMEAADAALATVPR